MAAFPRKPWFLFSNQISRILMKKYILIASIILSISLGAYAQNDEDKIYRAPDWGQIEGEVSNPGSKYYYPFLMSRYQASDTTLTHDDYYYLYYGYSTQPGYRPFLEAQYADSLKWAFAMKTTPTADVYRRVVNFCTEVLAEEPFNIRDINALAFAYQMLEQPEKADRELLKMAMIAETIKSTGSGLAESSPWFIIYSKHAEDILNLLGANYTRAIIVSRTTEFVPVNNMQDRYYKGYYFNFSEIYKREPDYTDEIKGRRKLEVNPRYNPKSKLNILPR